MTLEFARHPVNLERLALAAKESSVRGMLARASLQNRLNEKILDEETAAKLTKFC
jgi:hypothetical protein